MRATALSKLFLFHVKIFKRLISLRAKFLDSPSALSHHRTETDLTINNNNTNEIKYQVNASFFIDLPERACVASRDSLQTCLGERNHANQAQRMEEEEDKEER